MTRIKPFIGIRPAIGKAARVAALPYDVYSRAEAKKEVEREPLSFLNIDRAETNLPDRVETYDPEVYETARDLLWGELRDGIFVEEEKPCYYLYELTVGAHTQTGIVACSSVDDYLNGVVKKHENTTEYKEQDRIRHVDVTGAQTGPIFLAYRARQALKSLVLEAKGEGPLYDFVSPDGVRHRVFRISQEETIRAITAEFAAVPAAYIADGHHRAASAVKVAQKRRAEHPGYTGEEEFNYFLSVLFPDDELQILPYNRVVRDLNGLSKGQFLEAVREKFSVREVSGVRGMSRPDGISVPDACVGESVPGVPGASVGASAGSAAGEGVTGTPAGSASAGIPAIGVSPREKGTFGLLLGANWYELRVKREFCPEDPVDRLDVSILQEQILRPLLGISDPRTDRRIEFIGGIRGNGELERRVAQGCAAAFSLYPTSMEELLAVADAGRLMPPKSTWFEPKLRSGLLIHRL